MKARLGRGWWREVGFRDEPEWKIARAALPLYRAWGGGSSKSGDERSAGVCFSTQRPQRRTEAERLFSVWEWGNSCFWLTEFELGVGEGYYAGWVDPGAFVDARLQHPQPGVQIFVENPVGAKLRERRTTPLLDDMGGIVVVSGSRRWQ